jgi:hypothetical protein
MRLLCLSECRDASRTGYSVPRSLLGVPFGRHRGVPARACRHLLSKVVRPLTGFSPSSETPSGAAHRHHDGLPSLERSGLPPMRFLAPPADEARRIGLVRIHPDAFPSPVFRRPSRVSSSSSPAALFHAAAAHGVPPFRASPCRSTPPGSSPGDPLSAFLRLPKESAAPPGGFVRPSVRHPRRECCIPSQTAALLGFIASTALRTIGFAPSLDGASAHGLFFGSVLARPRRRLQRLSARPPGISRSRGRRPSWRSWPSGLRRIVARGRPRSVSGIVAARGGAAARPCS